VRVLSGCFIFLSGKYITVLVALSCVEILLTTVVVRLYHNKARHKPLRGFWHTLTSCVTVISCVGTNYESTNTSSTPTSESEIESSIESANTTTTDLPAAIKNPIKRRLSLKTISPDHSFAASSKEDFRKQRGARAWGDRGTLCGRGPNRKCSWEDLSRGLDRVFLLVFTITRMILAVVYLTIIQVGG